MEVGITLKSVDIKIITQQTILATRCATSNTGS